MSLNCYEQLDTLITIFDLPLHKLSEWINGCYCEYPLQSIKQIRKLMLEDVGDGQLNAINKIIKSNIVPQILKLLTRNNYTVLMLCYGYIRKIDFQYEIPKEIIHSIDSFCITNNFPDHRLQTEIKWILSYIAGGSPDHTRYIVKNDAMSIIMPQIVENCSCDDLLTQFLCTKISRKLLSIERDPPIKGFIDLGIIGRLIEILQIDQDNADRYPLQLEAAWCLTNIATGTAENVAAVLRFNAVPIFVKLLNSKSNEVKEQIIWALGNIAGDSPECRDLVLSYGALDNLFPIFNMNQPLNILRNATWTLSNMCRGSPSPPFKYVEICLKALSIMINSNDIEILQDTCWAFSHLLDTNTTIKKEEQELMFEMIVNSDSLNRLIELLDHHSPCIRHPALRSIGSFITGDIDDYDYKQKAIHFGLLKKLHGLLPNDRLTIKREACWTISNITAGSSEYIQHVMDCKLFEQLIDILQNEKYEIAKEALWAISNATSGATHQQIAYLVNHGAIKPLCSYIDPQKPPKIILIAMEGIGNILSVGNKLSNDGCNEYTSYVEESDGVQFLRAIMSDQSIPDEIHDKAFAIITQYFND